jgi:oxidase EvaA
VQFATNLIGLDEVGDWARDERAICGKRAVSFSASRVESDSLREVTSWDQPILTQLDGGILGMVARESAEKGVEFLLQAIPECGNIGVLQLGPTIQSTWSNIRRAHGGRRPPMIEVLFAGSGVRIIYRANHNEEGGRFWQKSNENILAFINDERVIETDMKMYHWASLSQIRELALMDNVLDPFVKTVLFPL